MYFLQFYNSQVLIWFAKKMNLSTHICGSSYGCMSQRNDDETYENLSCTVHAQNKTVGM